MAIALAGFGVQSRADEPPADAGSADSAPAAVPKDKHALDTVVVTAQKRKEDIKEVPMSVSAISGDDLAHGQVNDVTDLTRSIPNFSFSAQGGAGPGLGNLEIRGVSSQAGSSTVGVYLDDISLTTRNLYSQGTAEPRMFDLDRVEVLRGPQGTLYGASSMGGTLRFISRQPDTRRQTIDVSAGMSATDHGGTNYQVEAVLNQPLVADTAALRIGVQTGHDSGYIDQVDPASLRVISNGINKVDWTTLKLAGRFSSSGWSFTPALFYQRTTTGDIDAAMDTVGGYQQFNAGATLAPFQTSKIVREPGKDTLAIPSLTINGDVGFADLTAVLSGYDRHFSRTQDGTSVNSSYIGSLISNAAVSNVVSFLPSAVYLDNKIAQTSVEVRLASKLPDVTNVPFSWVGGIYWNREKTDVTDNEPVFGITQAFTSAGVDINDPNQWSAGSGIFTGAFPNDNSYFSNRHYLDHQKSVFGEVTWYALPTLRLSAGLRYLKGSQDFSREGGDFFAGTTFTSTQLSTEASKTTPRFTVDWDVDPQNTLYATAAEGFRLGGANRPIPQIAGVVSDLLRLGFAPGQAAPNSFGPDSLWSYEVGTKSRFLDNRVSLNLAAFLINWSNTQQDIVLPTAGFDFEYNVGNSRNTGIELELKAKATDDLTLTLDGGVIRAQFTEDVSKLGSTNGVLNVRSGDPVAGVPRYNLNVGAEYRFDLLEHNNVLRMSVQNVGSSHGTVIRSDPDYLRAGYTTVDASWDVLFGDAWDLSFKVKNLNNDRTVLQHPNVQFVSESYYLRPRTIGVNLTGNF